jgi:DNA/RNA-binding domain of Phe-tRNA-synthetase-like protein
MEFKIDPKLAELFPEVKVGVLIGKGLNNRRVDQLAPLLREVEEGARKKSTLELLTTLPKISDWRKAYQKFGFKPKTYRSSIEALMRRVLQGKELPFINPIVDLYNLISIKYLLPAGGDDLNKVEGEIFLTIAEGTEKFVMLGSQKTEEIKKGEVVYKDYREVLCRAWNYRECEKTKITENTVDVCLVLEGLEHSSKEEIVAALSELKDLLQSNCQGTYEQFFLDRNHLMCSF